MKPGQHRQPHPDSVPPSHAPIARFGDSRLDGPPTAIFPVALAALREGFSVIPLIGGDDPLEGKRPAIKWKRYTRQLPTEDDLRTWFIKRAFTAYGIVCGPISRLIVLDLDDQDIARRFAEQFPHLMNTRIVRSGLRGTPHIYWRIARDDKDSTIDVPWSKSRKVTGGDLKGQGGYVVGPGSSIAGGRWEISNDNPIRTLSPGELNEALNMLAANNGHKQTQPAAFAGDYKRPPQQQASGDFVAIYRSRVAETGQRNNTFFEVVRHIRDEGYPQQWATEALTDIHAAELPRNGQCQENYKRRIAEACATIASVYSRPARRKSTSDEQVSLLPNTVRERLLQQPDGAAIIRTLEGLYLKGLRPGDTFTEKEACRMLKGIVGRHSIIKAIKSKFSLALFYPHPSFPSPPCNPLYPANAEQKKGIENLQKTCCLSSGQNQTKGRSPKQYIYPSIDDLCACLGVEPSGSDPLRLEDLKSPKTLRMALEREFIKRRPGQYFQDLLAARLGVSDRTIRRYHRDIPILSQPQYLETPVLGFNIDRIPTADTIKRYDLDLGGQFLEDDTGKRWPLKQEIARMLLSRGHHVTHKVKTASYYYFGNALPPPEALYSPRTAAGPPMEGQVRPTLAEDKDKRPTPLREKRAAAQREPATRPVKGGGGTNKDKATVQLPLLPGLEPCSIPSKPARPPRKRGKDRHYAKPLADVYLEQLAKDIHHQVDRLSLSNARQLIEMYGPDLVKRTLGKMKWLEREGKLRSPAGFMITAIRVAWKEEGEWGGGQSSFKSILPRKTDSNDDTLLQSEAHRKWRADFGWDGDYLTLSLIEEDLPY